MHKLGFLTVLFLTAVTVASGQTVEPDALLQSCLAKVQANQFAEAVTECAAVIKLEPKNSSALEGRSQAYIGLKKYKLALADLSKAIQLSYGIHKKDRLLARVQLYNLQNNLRGVIADTTTIIRLYPTGALSKAYYERAKAFNLLKKHTPAIADLTKAITAHPGYEEAYRERAIAYRAISKIDLAQADESKANQIKKEMETK